ncbi:MAG: hypothetical protein ABFS86_14940 [Planctomycetota bacterium]
MKRIETVTLSIAEVNEQLGVDMEPGFWEALVTMLAYPELTYDPAGQSIRFPDYVPFRELAGEFIEGMEGGIYDIRLCERCAGYFDLNRTEGIFSDPAEMEGFLCMPCAEAMTAREFYEKHLRIR